MEGLLNVTEANATGLSVVSVAVTSLLLMSHVNFFTTVDEPPSLLGRPLLVVLGDALSARGLYVGVTPPVLPLGFDLEVEEVASLQPAVVGALLQYFARLAPFLHARHLAVCSAQQEPNFGCSVMVSFGLSMVVTVAGSLTFPG